MLDNFIISARKSTSSFSKTEPIGANIPLGSLPWNCPETVKWKSNLRP